MRTEFIEEYLVFARHLSFSRAAAELHITQPNLSKHMAELEREVGVELIDRKTFGKNRPVLSKAGKFFAEEMAYLESSFQETIKRCQAIGRSDMRDIRIQELWQNNAMFELYAIAGSYQGEHSENNVRYVRFTDKLPIDALLDNEFDIVLEVWCGPYADHCAYLAEQGIRAMHFITEPLYIWYQEGNRHLGGKRSIKLEELLEIPVIMSRGVILDYMVVSYAAYCNREGLTPRLRHIRYTDNSPTGVFMSDFRDSVLMTSPAMVRDPRLQSRSDLTFAVVDDERVAATFLLAARCDDREASAFLDYVSRHRKP